MDNKNNNKKTEQDNYLNVDPEDIVTSAEVDYKQYDKVLSLKKEVNDEIDNIKQRVDALIKSKDLSDHRLADLHTQYLNRQLAPAYGKLQTQSVELEHSIQNKMSKYNQIKNQRRPNKGKQSDKNDFKL